MRCGVGEGRRLPDVKDLDPHLDCTLDPHLSIMLRENRALYILYPRTWSSRETVSTMRRNYLLVWCLVKLPDISGKFEVRVHHSKLDVTNFLCV
ncbi:hypothetical protein GRJ2_001527900 [Grus japonensis]|uniref:Uncharacterized protein n=1 Tax=Grus japonensis TaxID=30415 RepID=A0ABC9WZM5_GRUJA